jgi:uncharacterized protein with ParB-like and HNH nuclease domain
MSPDLGDLQSYRDYSWDQEQWEDLWEDIENLQEEEHYMGYIVLQRNEGDKNNLAIFPCVIILVATI